MNINSRRVKKTKLRTSASLDARINSELEKENESGSGEECDCPACTVMSADKEELLLGIASAEMFIAIAKDQLKALDGETSVQDGRLH